MKSLLVFVFFFLSVFNGISANSELIFSSKQTGKKVACSEGKMVYCKMLDSQKHRGKLLINSTESVSINGENLKLDSIDVFGFYTAKRTLIGIGLIGLGTGLSIHGYNKMQTSQDLFGTTGNIMLFGLGFPVALIGTLVAPTMKYLRMDDWEINIKVQEKTKS